MNCGEDSIVYSSCKVHRVISVSRTVTFIRIQSSTYWVWSFLIVSLKFVSVRSVCTSMHARVRVCVCVYRQWCSQTGWHGAEWLSEMKKFFMMSSTIFIYWSKSKYIEYTIVNFKFMISYERPFWLCVLSPTNIAMPLVWKYTNSASHLLLWTDQGCSARVAEGLTNILSTGTMLNIPYCCCRADRTM
jgi:hypothetical protein